MPERQGGFISLPVGQADNFDFRQPVRMIQIEDHDGRTHATGPQARPDETVRVCESGMRNLNARMPATIGERENKTCGQRDEQRQKNPLFFCHKK